MKGTSLKFGVNSSCFSMIIRHVTNLTENGDKQTVHPVFSEVRYMTDDHRETGTVYPMFSVRFATWRMILEKQELFIPSLKSSCFSRIIRHVTNLTENGDKQFLLLYDHPSCNEPHWKQVRYMTDDHREAGTVYHRFSVRFVTSRMIIEKQELFTPGFQWGLLHDGWF
jgi:hypothetical protein